MKKRNASQRGKFSRVKGRAFEQEIARRFRVVFKDAKRHLEFQTQEAHGVDLDNTGVYRVQCKRGRRYASLSAMKEICYAPELGEVPVLVTQGDHQDVLAVLPFEDFLRLLQETYLKHG